MKIFDYVKSLGFVWFFFRIIYEAKKKIGYFKKFYPISLWEDTPLESFIDRGYLKNYIEYRKTQAPQFFFSSKSRNNYKFTPSLKNVIDINRGFFNLFSFHKMNLGFPPNWFSDPFFHNIFPYNVHWSEIDDFDFGDIKTVYEVNRFSFVFDLVRAYFKTNDEKYIKIFWKIFLDWTEKNPPNQGVNWKCGQEVSFRVFALLFAYYAFLNSKETTDVKIKKLTKVIYISSNRIRSNFSYAMSQKNNHGISESVALFSIGMLFPEFKNSQKIKNIGRRCFIKQVADLVYDDGTFSQHSFNYHRLVLDLMIWAVRLAEIDNKPFFYNTYDRLYSLSQCLYKIMDKETGLMPNYGANDGALIFPVTNASYRDYRPQVQAGFLLSKKARAFDKVANYNEILFWFGIPNGPKIEEKIVKKPYFNLFQYGGLYLIHQKKYKIFISAIEKYIHRPVHLDNLHMDLWIGGKNVLCDTGSYSYNPLDEKEDFTDNRYHNVVSFDNHSQMQKRSRFFYGKWRGSNLLKFEKHSNFILFEFEYKDWKGCIQHRKIKSYDKKIIIKDSIFNFKNQAVLKWHLSPDYKWQQSGDGCVTNDIEIKITCSNTLKYFVSLVQGDASLYYLAKQKINVLIATVFTDCDEIITEINF